MCALVLFIFVQHYASTVEGVYCCIFCSLCMVFLLHVMTFTLLCLHNVLLDLAVTDTVVLPLTTEFPSQDQ